MTLLRNYYKSSSRRFIDRGTRGVFGLTFKVLLLLKKPKAKSNGPTFFMFF
jgi:hypothetical protein